MPPNPDGVRITAILGIVALAGCHPPSDGLDRNHDGVTRIACLGDSNTASFLERSWCDVLGETSPDWVMSNRSAGGMTIIDFGATYGGFVLAAAPHVDEMLTIDHPDVAILAFGTNDLWRWASPQRVVDAYAQTKAKIERTGVRCLIALTPPTQPPQPPALNNAIRDLNARLRTAFPSDIVDFWSGITEADIKPDGLHMNAAGQAKRAAAAREALLR
jgi:lysophospholipase L1-like esterase